MRRLRILLVEDYPDCADSTRHLLDLWGCQVEIASDGTAALKLAQDHPRMSSC